MIIQIRVESVDNRWVDYYNSQKVARSYMVLCIVENPTIVLADRVSETDKIIAIAFGEQFTMLKQHNGPFCTEQTFL